MSIQLFVCNLIERADWIDDSMDGNRMYWKELRTNVFFFLSFFLKNKKVKKKKIEWPIPLSIGKPIQLLFSNYFVIFVSILIDNRGIILAEKKQNIDA